METFALRHFSDFFLVGRNERHFFSRLVTQNCSGMEVSRKFRYVFVKRLLRRASLGD